MLANYQATVYKQKQMKRWKREAIRIIVAAIIFAGCYYLSGCAAPKLSAPSGVGVSSGIGRTQTSVTQAQRYNDVAIVHNTNASSRVSRIEAKAAVIERYWSK